ncbi:MAG: GNAT family N-acetyltransferase [Lachnospiraceae bacterium]|nr:GNAT family N-acetyltransferase [Lachnospiraceae bacterium]
MNIRKAEEKDKGQIMNLLSQVLMVHHLGRPDLFKGNCTKYTDKELSDLIHNPQTPILVAVSETEEVLGYAFCQFHQKKGDNILTDIKTLYIDDLCVDEAHRGKAIGRELYEAVLRFAKESGCYNVTLNVWECNETAKHFYEKCGLAVQKIGMEKIL